MDFSGLEVRAYAISATIAHQRQFPVRPFTSCAKEPPAACEKTVGRPSPTIVMGSRPLIDPLRAVSLEGHVIVTVTQ